jgi:hypothetical protein
MKRITTLFFVQPNSIPRNCKATSFVAKVDAFLFSFFFEKKGIFYFIFSKINFGIAFTVRIKKNKFVTNL